MSEEARSEENTRIAVALLDNRQEALEEILRLYGPSIIARLLKIYAGVLKFEDVEDVLSIALRKLWNNRFRYDDNKRSVRTWLFCIADNVAKDVIKSGWHRAQQLEQNPGEDWLEENIKAPEIVHNTEETPKGSKAKVDLQQVIQALPDVQRRIILADGAARDDVASSEFLADELGIPAGTVRVYRSRAMDKIRTEMRKRGHNVP